MENGKWRMGNGDAKAKFGIVCVKWKLFLFFPFFIFHFSSSILGASFRLPHWSPSASWQEHREKCGLYGFYVLEGIAAGGAVINHAAARRAERAVQARVLRVTERAGDCFAACQFELY